MKKPFIFFPLGLLLVIGCRESEDQLIAPSTNSVKTNSIKTEVRIKTTSTENPSADEDETDDQTNGRTRKGSIHWRN